VNPVQNDAGEVIGALGISDNTAENDQTIAEAGTSA